MSRINEHGEIIRDAAFDHRSGLGGSIERIRQDYSFWWPVVVAMSGLCFFLVGGGSLLAVFQDRPGMAAEATTNDPMDAPVIVALATESSSFVGRNSLAPSNSQSTPIPVSYQCPDEGIVQLQVGAWGQIGKPAVALRKEPAIPDVWDANVIRILLEGERIFVLGGPACSHEGTWWQIKTEFGEMGWSREYLQNQGHLLIRANP